MGHNWGREKGDIDMRQGTDGNDGNDITLDAHDLHGQASLPFFFVEIIDSRYPSSRLKVLCLNSPQQ